jgi:hypothetical protein
MTGYTTCTTVSNEIRSNGSMMDLFFFVFRYRDVNLLFLSHTSSELGLQSQEASYPFRLESRSDYVHVQEISSRQERIK